MPLRPPTVLALQPLRVNLSRKLPHRPVTSTSSSTTVVRHSSSGDSHYDPPSGWLFGVPPGQKAPKEGWENVWVYGFFGSLLFGVVAYAYKPDTSIQTWALEEARRRLEAEGILKDEEN